MADFPPAAARKWQQTSAKSMFSLPLSEPRAKKDYMDELLEIPKYVTPMSPEQWNSTPYSMPKQPAKAISTSLHFSRSEISKSTSQLGENIREDVMIPIGPDVNTGVDGDGVGERKKEVVVK